MGAATAARDEEVMAEGERRVQDTIERLQSPQLLRASVSRRDTWLLPTYPGCKGGDWQGNDNLHLSFGRLAPTMSL